MRTASIIINWTIFVATFALTLRCFRHEGEWALRRGLKAFRYFTVLSNVFCAITALVMALAGALFKLTKRRWISDYALPISLIAGMAGAIPITAWLS